MTEHTGYYYLATSYTNHPGGLFQANRMAVRAAGFLLKAGVPVFSPIAHSHTIAENCGLPLTDHNLWMKIDAPMMDAAVGLILLKVGGWEKSRGIAHEVKAFRDAGKPTYWMEHETVPVFDGIGFTTETEWLVEVALERAKGKPPVGVVAPRAEVVA